MDSDSILRAAQEYGAAWAAFAAAGDKAESEEGHRKDYSPATQENLNRLARQRNAAHKKLLRALGALPL